jgi:hypothetical protein
LYKSGREEVGDGELAAFALARESESQFLPRLCHLRLVHNDVVAFALGRKVSIDSLGLENTAGDDLFFQLPLDGSEFLLH